MDFKICRICMSKENLLSVFSIMDGGRIFEKMQFIGIKVNQLPALNLTFIKIFSCFRFHLRIRCLN